MSNRKGGGDTMPIIRNPDPPDWYEVTVSITVQVQDVTDKKEIVQALEQLDEDDFEIMEVEKV